MDSRLQQPVMLSRRPRRRRLTAIDLVVWANANANPGTATATDGLYRGQHRLLPLFNKGSATHVNNIWTANVDAIAPTFWTYSAPWGGPETRRSRQDHPITKPTAMLEDALTDLTHRQHP